MKDQAKAKDDTEARKAALAKGRDLYPKTVLDLIAKIEAVQTKLKNAGALAKTWSDEVFCLGCPSMKANRWSQLRSGVYPYPANITTQMRLVTDLEGLAEWAGLHELAVRKAEQDAKAALTKRDYIEFAEYQEIAIAIEECERKADTTSQNRAVVFVAKSGHGKDELRAALERAGKVQWTVQGRPSWRQSYAAFLHTLGDRLGLEMPSANWRGEDLILAHLGSVAGVLAIEEVEALSKQALEFLKTLLNGTRITILMLLTPAGYRRICRDKELSEQFNRRTHLTLMAGAITAAHVRAFGPALWAQVPEKNQDSDQRFLAITKQANALGGLDCVQDITTRLLALQRGKPDRAPTLAEVIEEVDFYAGTKRKESLLTAPERIRIAA